MSEYRVFVFEESYYTHNKWKLSTCVAAASLPAALRKAYKQARRLSAVERSSYMRHDLAANVARLYVPRDARSAAYHVVLNERRAAEEKATAAENVVLRAELAAQQARLDADEVRIAELKAENDRCNNTGDTP